MFGFRHAIGIAFGDIDRMGRGWFVRNWRGLLLCGLDRRFWKLEFNLSLRDDRCQRCGIVLLHRRLRRRLFLRLFKQFFKRLFLKNRRNLQACRLLIRRWLRLLIGLPILQLPWLLLRLLRNKRLYNSNGRILQVSRLPLWQLASHYRNCGQNRQCHCRRNGCRQWKIAEAHCTGERTDIWIALCWQGTRSTANDCPPGAWWMSTKAFAGQNADCVDVGRRGNFPASELFWRCITRRPHADRVAIDDGEGFANVDFRSLGLLEES